MKKQIFFFCFLLSFLFVFSSEIFAEDQNQTKIKIVRLEYSCYRHQSDSENPVFIKKKKPVFDLMLKINRCFVNKDGYPNPEFTITYDYFGGNNTKYMSKIDKDSWIKLNSGCYEEKNLKDFKKISCN